MQKLTRREFLKGLFQTSVVAATAPLASVIWQDEPKPPKPKLPKFPTSTGRKVDWRWFEELEEFQQECPEAAIEFCPRHIEFEAKDSDNQAFQYFQAWRTHMMDFPIFAIGKAMQPQWNVG